MAEIADAAPPRVLGQRDLTQGAIGPTLIAFALPTLGANVLQSLNGTINAIWIGNFLGEAALAATAVANNVMFLMVAAILGLSLATTILIGQAIGAGDLDRARRTIASSMTLLVGVNLATAVLGWVFTPAIVQALATPPGSEALAVTYLRVIFAGLPFGFFTLMLSSGLRGAGDSITPLRAMVLTVALDAGLNPVLILGLGPFPPLGIAGSALATLIAGVVTTLALIAYIYMRDLPLRLRGHELAYLKGERALIATIVGKGLPMGLSMVVLGLAGLSMMGLVNRAGVNTAAAFGAISQLWAYVQMPALAIGAGVSAMAAQNIGAGRWDRVDRITLWGSGINLVLTGAALAVIALADRFLLGLFLTPGSPAVPIGVHIHTIVGWSFLLFGVSMVLGSTMRANGVVYAPLVIMAIAFFPVRFAFALALLPYWGVEAVWWSFPLGSAVALALSAAWYRHGSWRRVRLLPAHETPA